MRQFHQPQPTYLCLGCGDAGQLGDNIPGRYFFLPQHSWSTCLLLTLPPLSRHITISLLSPSHAATLCGGNGCMASLHPADRSAAGPYLALLRELTLYKHYCCIKIGCENTYTNCMYQRGASGERCSNGVLWSFLFLLLSLQIFLCDWLLIMIISSLVLGLNLVYLCVKLS